MGMGRYVRQGNGITAPWHADEVTDGLDCLGYPKAHRVLKSISRPDILLHYEPPILKWEPKAGLGFIWVVL